MTEPILRFFEYEEVPSGLERDTALAFYDLAYALVGELPRTAVTLNSDASNAGDGVTDVQCIELPHGLPEDLFG